MMPLLTIYNDIVDIQAKLNALSGVESLNAEVKYIETQSSKMALIYLLVDKTVMSLSQRKQAILTLYPIHAR